MTSASMQPAGWYWMQGTQTMIDFFDWYVGHPKDGYPCIILSKVGGYKWRSTSCGTTLTNACVICQTKTPEPELLQDGDGSADG